MSCQLETELRLRKSKKSDSSNELYPGTANKTSSYNIVAWDGVGDLSSHQPLMKQELKARFCLSSYKLIAHRDFSDVLDIICTNKQPNENFDRLDRLASKGSGKPTTVQHFIEHTADGFTSAKFVTVYRVPIVPKLIRHVPIANIISSESYFGYLKMSGKVLEDQSASLGGDLQYGKWLLSSRMELLTPDKTVFSSERKTTLDTYQLEGGSNEMGIGVEYLSEDNNPDYRHYHQATLSIANTDATSTMIQLVNITTRNNGFPTSIQQMFIDASTVAAEKIYEGIKTRQDSGFFKKISN